MCLVSEEKTFQETGGGVIIGPLTDTLATFIALVLVALALSLKDLQFVRKQFRVTTNDFHNRTGNPHIL